MIRYSSSVRVRALGSLSLAMTLMGAVFVVGALLNLGVLGEQQGERVGLVMIALAMVGLSTYTRQNSWLLISKRRILVCRKFFGLKRYRCFRYRDLDRTEMSGVTLKLRIFPRAGRPIVVYPTAMRTQGELPELKTLKKPGKNESELAPHPMLKEMSELKAVIDKRLRA